jgi:hypothetical protein
MRHAVSFPCHAPATLTPNLRKIEVAIASTRRNKLAANEFGKLFATSCIDALRSSNPNGSENSSPPLEAVPFR